jgi:hypothetical protein
MNALEAKRAMATCQHFNGVMNHTCHAGLAYPKGQALPCIAPFSPNITQPSCPKYLATTLDILMEQEKEWEEIFAKTNRARQAIVDATKGERNRSGHITCPICMDGQLGFRVHHNGHIHAKCATKGCVSWME